MMKMHTISFYIACLSLTLAKTLARVFFVLFIQSHILCLFWLIHQISLSADFLVLVGVLPFLNSVGQGIALLDVSKDFLLLHVKYRRGQIP